MSRYMLVFHDDQCDVGALSADERQALFGEFVSWAADLHERGIYRGSEALTGNDKAQTIRKRGTTLVLEGPFAETAEAVNGFIIIDAEDDHSAATIARECPSLRLGWAVEIRELVEIDKPGDY